MFVPKWFLPKWNKEALLLLQEAQRFVHYKLDLLKPDRLSEIQSRRQDLIEAIRSKDQAKVAEASKQLRSTCEKSLPGQKPIGWLEENVESLFVSAVIVLGVMTFVLRPFRIPTGSMQPTLNGIIGTPLAKPPPGFATRMVEKVLRGRTYVRVVNDQDRHIAIKDGRPDLADTQFLHFFSRSQIRFSDAPPINLPAPLSVCSALGLTSVMEYAYQHNGLIPKGAVLCEGTIDSGDLVIVDKFSYHFRKPKRGEVFVFNTIAIEGTKKSAGSKRGAIAEQEDATHYIKRLGGVPGDSLSITPPNLLVDGKIAREPGFENVYNLPLFQQPGKKGYSLASKEHSAYPPVLVTPESRLVLKKDAPPGMREYAALGDNSGNSLDSRYWGTVKEFNLVGPAWFSLWPITTGHWGTIH